MSFSDPGVSVAISPHCRIYNAQLGEREGFRLCSVLGLRGEVLGWRTPSELPALLGRWDFKRKVDRYRPPAGGAV